MPTDHLTTSPYQLANSVHTVLTGADLYVTAKANALDPADLDEAVHICCAAGLAALERRAEDACYQVRVEFPDWDSAETVGATQLGPRLDQLQNDKELTGWWFLRKHPCWRLRLHDASITAVNHTLDELTTIGAITRWWPTIYEPETAAFGGMTGMNTIHDLFSADTRGVLTYLRHKPPNIGRRELSILLLNGLLRAAALDNFERGDVFDRVAQLRPAPADIQATRMEQLAENLRPLLLVPDPHTSELFSSGGSAAHAEPWLRALQTIGRHLGGAAAQGQLGRGLRAILTHVVIFHWNRLGLSASSQAILARAATTALLPGD